MEIFMGITFDEILTTGNLVVREDYLCLPIKSTDKNKDYITLRIKEIEDTSSLQKSYSEAKRIFDWAETVYKSLPVEWLNDHWAEWENQASNAITSKVLNFLHDWYPLRRTTNPEKFAALATPLINLISTLLFETDYNLENWTHKHAIYWLRRLEEEKPVNNKYNFDSFLLNEWKEIITNYQIFSEFRIQLKKHTLGSLAAYVDKIITNILNEIFVNYDNYKHPDKDQTYETCLQFIQQQAQKVLNNQTASQPKARNSLLFATSFPQYTFIEAKSMQIAIANGKKLRNWKNVDGEIALLHTTEGNPIQTKLTPGTMLDYKNLPITYDSLKAQLQQCDLTTVLLVHVAIEYALKYTQVTICIDDLCNSIGLTRREKTEREEARQKVWEWLLLFDSITVHGRRKGQYKDPITKKVLDLTSRDALIKIIGKRLEENQGTTPLEVSFVAGPWLDQWRSNAQVLQYFGDISRIAKIPSGKPSGALAQSIGLALNQLWRENASRTNISYSGENNKKTAQCQLFTKFQLLDMFPCEPNINSILESKNPIYAQNYWSEAIKILKRQGIISYYREVDPMPKKRTGWQKFWLEEQKLEIRPNSTDTDSIADLSRKALKAKKAKKQSTKK